MSILGMCAWGVFSFVVGWVLYDVMKVFYNKLN